MQLYTSTNSPFSARVAIALQAKAVAIEAAALPAGGLKSPEFLAINPIAKIPVLDIGDGNVLPESTVILRYLEDRYPLPSLLPASAAERARINAVVAIMDAYVMAPVIRLFPHLAPGSRDTAVVAAEVQRWQDGMGVLAHWLQSPLPKAQAAVSLADCVIAPSLHLSRRISLMLGLEKDPADQHDAIRGYHDAMKVHPIVGPVLEGLTRTQEAYDLKAGRPSIGARH
jgi:glutathione S-transferase